MNIGKLSILVVFFVNFLFSATCRNKEDVELLKSRLNTGINASDRHESAKHLDRLLKSGVDPKTIPIDEAADLILEKVNLAYQWETTTGDELVRLYGPLEGLQNGTWRGAGPARGVR